MPNILTQLHYLVTSLCNAHNATAPVELTTIAPVKIMLYFLYKFESLLIRLQMTIAMKGMEANWRAL